MVNKVLCVGPRARPDPSGTHYSSPPDLYLVSGVRLAALKTEESGKGGERGRDGRTKERGRRLRCWVDSRP